MKKLVVLWSCALMLGLAAPLASAGVKIGFVNTDQVFREAAPALSAQKKLEKEFAPREKQLQKMAQKAKALQSDLEKNGITMSESKRRAKERALANLNLEFQRSQREFREDLNLRRNEELSLVQDLANKAIAVVARREKYDLILQQAVYISPRIDITKKVIKEMAK